MGVNRHLQFDQTIADLSSHPGIGRLLQGSNYLSRRNGDGTILSAKMLVFALLDDG
jgi:hypothetical protein